MSDANRISHARRGAGLAVAAALTGVLVVAGSGPIRAEDGARAEVRCEGPDGPVDLAACLPDSRLEIGREGVITAYRAEDLGVLGDASSGTLNLILPFNFRVMAQNTGADTRLFLRIATPSGRTVHTAEAGRYEWVQFTHCGPQIDPACRDYNYGDEGRVRPAFR